MQKNSFHAPKYIWGKKSSSTPDLLDNTFFRGFENAYVSKCRNITRCRRNMVDSAFESWWSILFDPKKILVIRTHPEELRVIKSISSTHISSNFSQQWGQRMLTKCYPTSQGCSCDFQILKVRHFGGMFESWWFIFLVLESHRKIPVMLGNIWSTFVDLIVDYN